MSLSEWGWGVLALLFAVLGLGVLFAALMGQQVRADVRARREQRLRGEGRG